VKRSLLLWMCIVGVILPFMVYPVLAMEILCFTLFASAFHLLLGYGGLLSFGHAAFFGLGSFICGHVLKEYGWDPALGLLSGCVSGLLMGWCVGLIALRRQGIYFAMVTLALAQILFFILLQAPFTGGEDGLQGIPRHEFLGVLNLQTESTLLGTKAPWGLYGLTLAIVMLGHAVIFRIVDSPTGLALHAVQDHEPRARSLGLPASQLKMGLMIISAAFSGLAGALKALVLGLASLSDAAWNLSGEVVLMTLLGGVGTLAGPPLGAFLLRYLHHTLASLGSWVTVVLGLIFMACVLIFRRGIVGEYLAMKKKHPPH
jgi:branched-chain amino acid transport system permease protein